MAANYLHGAEVIEVQRGSRPIRIVKSAVIGLVGTAPTGPKNQPIMCLSEKDDAQFGDQIPGFSIPQALSSIRDQGPCVVLVVNVFDATANTVSVTLEAKTVANRQVTLDFAPIGALQIFQTDGTTPAGLVVGTDYTVSPYGKLTLITGSVVDGTALKFTYKRMSAATVTDAQVIGEVEVDSTRTGMQCFDIAYSTFGFSAKILIAPQFSEKDAIAAELRSKADKYKAIALLDAPEGVTPAEAIEARGPLGDFSGFNTSSARAYLLYPRVKSYDPATDTSIDKPYSQFMAGVICNVDNNQGYWKSPSNEEIEGVTGLERFIEASIDDPTCEANVLNEAGITTVFNGFGTGFRTWGNRSAAWPSSTLPENFLCVRRTADVIHESLVLAMLQFIDLPVTNPVIDAIRESVNAFLRTLVARGAIVDGNCTFNPDNNPPEELAAGHLTFDIDFMPPTPAERITFQSFINIALLKALTTS